MGVLTRNDLGDKFVGGLAAKLAGVVDQTKNDYVLVNQSAVAVEGNNSTALFKTRESTNARETIGGLTAFGDLELTNETEDYKNDDYSSGFEAQYNFKKYTKNFAITEEMIDDGLAEADIPRVAARMTAAKRTANKHMFEAFNKGFTAQATNVANSEFLTFYGDGVPTFSTIHPLKVAGGTDSNASATGLPYSEDNQETARTELQEQLGDRGELLEFGSGSLILLVPHTLEKKAVIVNKGKLRSGTANNDINIYDGIVTVMSTKWLSAANGGSDTQWFLIDAMNSPMLAYFRRQIRMHAPWIQNSNKNVNYDISGRWSMGPQTWRGMWGSLGNGEAYAL